MSSYRFLFLARLNWGRGNEKFPVFPHVDQEPYSQAKNKLRAGGKRSL